jgi:hypothetical protein
VEHNVEAMVVVDPLMMDYYKNEDAFISRSYSKFKIYLALQMGHTNIMQKKNEMRNNSSLET